jgi:hypothetical protein
MDKKLMLALVTVLVLGGGLFYFKQVNDTKIKSGDVSTEIGLGASQNVYIDGEKMYVSVRERKVSMIDLKWSGDNLKNNFVINKDVFNSELLNEERDGFWHVVLGVMKPGADLPTGNILLGTFTSEVKPKLEAGKVTLAGTESVPAEEFEVKFLENK